MGIISYLFSYKTRLDDKVVPDVSDAQLSNLSVSTTSSPRQVNSPPITFAFKAEPVVTETTETENNNDTFNRFRVTSSPTGC